MSTIVDMRRKKNKDTFAENISRRVFENLRKYLYIK